MDQLRSELMQERSARHDLEMDKSALERQVLARPARLLNLSPSHRVLTTVRPAAGEGAKDPRGRHGGTEPTLGWTRPAGEEGSGGGGEAAQ